MVDVLPPVGAYPKWEVNGTATEGYITISVMQNGSIFVKQEMKTGAKTLLKTLQAINNAVTIKEEPMDEDDPVSANPSSTQSTPATVTSEMSHEDDSTCPDQTLPTQVCHIKINLNEPEFNEFVYEPGPPEVKPSVTIWPNLAQAAKNCTLTQDDLNVTDEEPVANDDQMDVKPNIVIKSVEGNAHPIHMEAAVSHSLGIQERKAPQAKKETTTPGVPKTKPKLNVYFKPNFSCEVCNKAFISALKLTEHLKTCGKEKNKKRKKVEDDVGYDFHCQVCVKNFKSELVLLAHMEKTHDVKRSNFKCAHCSETFSSLLLLQDHPCTLDEPSFGKPFGGFECSLCKLMFNKEEDHYKHWIENHGKIYPCTKCTQQFMSEADLENHMRKHEATTCDLCGKMFKFRCMMIRHKKGVHGEGEKPTMPCDVCGKLYKGMHCLKEHAVEAHGAPGRFKCSVCNKDFWQAKRLETHMRIHTGEKPFQCSECGKSFAYASSLYSHSQRHTTDRNYKCTMCDKSYTTKAYLKEHMDKHNPAKAVVCDLCGKSFKSKWFLKMHKEIHMDRRKYKCDICGTAYNNSGSLYTHKKKHCSPM